MRKELMYGPILGFALLALQACDKGGELANIKGIANAAQDLNTSPQANYQPDGTIRCYPKYGLLNIGSPE